MIPYHILAHREYLKSATWKDIRADILKRDNNTCQFCKNPGSDVHHLTYKNWGTENPSDLITLCRACHEQHHKVKNSVNNKKAIGTKALFSYLTDIQRKEVSDKFQIPFDSLYYVMCVKCDEIVCRHAASKLNYNYFYPQKVSTGSLNFYKWRKEIKRLKHSKTLLVTSPKKWNPTAESVPRKRNVWHKKLSEKKDLAQSKEDKLKNREEKAFVKKKFSEELDNVAKMLKL